VRRPRRRCAGSDEERKVDKLIALRGAPTRTPSKECREVLRFTAPDVALVPGQARCNAA